MSSVPSPAKPGTWNHSNVQVFEFINRHRCRGDALATNGTDFIGAAATNRHRDFARRAIQVRFDYLQCQTSRHHCIKRITTLFQDRHACRCRQSMSGRYHAEVNQQFGAGGEW